MEKEKNGKLYLIRHTESEWNNLGIWTGLTDIHLSKKGIKSAQKVGELVKNFKFDYIFDTPLSRSQETLAVILEGSVNNKDVPVEHAKEFNERDYGDYTGKNKWEIKKIIGEEEFLKLRRGWDSNVPNGENLKMVYERAVPFFLQRVMPLIKEGKNVLIVAHGNSIRALTKYIENISDEGVADVEINWGSVIIYDLDENGYSLNKEILKIEVEK